MNKQNKILLVILAFIVACTIGYALFSESITINGTATASGDFEITSTCTTGVSSEVGFTSSYLLNGPLGDGMEKKEMGYSDDSCSTTENVFSANTKLEYPSATRLFTMKITNAGTVAAKFDFENTNGFTDRKINGIEGDNELYATAIFVKDNKIYDIDTLPKLNPLESVYIVYCLYWNINDKTNNTDIKQMTASDTIPLIQATD